MHTLRTYMVTVVADGIATPITGPVAAVPEATRPTGPEPGWPLVRISHSLLVTPAPFVQLMVTLVGCRLVMPRLVGAGQFEHAASPVLPGTQLLVVPVRAMFSRVPLLALAVASFKVVTPGLLPLGMPWSNW